jgi:hypothetical protein
MIPVPRLDLSEPPAAMILASFISRFHGLHRIKEKLEDLSSLIPSRDLYVEVPLAHSSQHP